MAISLKINELPSFDLKATSATCSGSIVNNNGKIEILNLADGDRFDFVKDTVYTGSANYQTAQEMPVNGLIINNIANPLIDETYTIRVFNLNGCYTDKTIVLKKIDCGCLSTICVPFVVEKTKNRTK